jgi:hypothetical protein
MLAMCLSMIGRLKIIAVFQQPCVFPGDGHVRGSQY